MTTDRVYYSHNAEVHAGHKTNRLMVLWMTVGLGIGAVLALLLTPQAGKKVRASLSKLLGQGLNNGRDAVEPAIKRVEKEFDGLTKTVSQSVSNGRDAVEPLMKGVEHLI